MSIFGFTLNKKIGAAVLLCLIVVSLGAGYKTAHAQDATGVANVPIGTGTDFNSIMAHLKSFVLDHLASLVAKQILHQMTISVVNWINSGFKGSPAFLTNPQAFFLDVADQVTGAFISGDGVLSKLCSPFSLDLRLNLALGQTALSNERYTCTLSTVIRNAQNAHASVEVGTSPNGATLGDMMNGNIANNPNAISVNGASLNDTGDFLAGDFSVGGWPAFVALTTEPQNNEYGAYLQARSDLQQRIAERQAAANNDLNRGHGFLSWQNCKTIGTADSENIDQLNKLDEATADDPSVTVTTSKDGTVTYQSCTTDTPGSVLAGTLQKHVDSSATQLELANDINAVVDALVSQMVNQMLTAGLTALSSNSNGRVSFTAQLQQEQQQIYTQQVSQSRTQASQALTQSELNVQQVKSIYDQAVAAVTASKNAYLAARACFVSKQTSSTVTESATFPTSQIALIDTAVSTNVDPLLQTLNDKDSTAATQLTQVQHMQDMNTTQLASSGAYQQSMSYQQQIQTATNINANAANNLAQAQSDLTDAQNQATKFNADAARYQAACNTYLPTGNFGGITTP